MDTRQIKTGHGPTVIVQCLGDLKIRGWADPTILVKGNAFEVREGEKALHINGSGDLRLMVPSSALVSIAEVNGDLVVKNVAGDIELAQASGDVHLYNLGAIEVGDIKRDLSVRNLSGNFTANEVFGDASYRNVLDVKLVKVYGDCALRNVNGNVTINSVLGDLSLRTVNGDLEVDEVYRDAILRNLGGVSRIGIAHGDVRLRGGLVEGKHQFNANGDIVVRWPAGTPVDIQAAAPKISWRMGLEDVQEEAGSLSGHIGDGNTYLMLEAKRRIILKGIRSGSEPWEEYSGQEYDIEADISGLGLHIAGEINSRMTELGQRLEHQFGPEFAARMEQKAQKAALKAEEAAEKAVRKAEKAAKKAQWQINRRYPPSPAATSPKTQPRKAAEDEQLKILKMVEKGVISPEEANELLAAIDGT
jgi:hypothetical protein